MQVKTTGDYENMPTMTIDRLCPRNNFRVCLRCLINCFDWHARQNEPKTERRLRGEHSTWHYCSLSWNRSIKNFFLALHFLKFFYVKQKLSKVLWVPTLKREQTGECFKQMIKIESQGSNSKVHFSASIEKPSALNRSLRIRVVSSWGNFIGHSVNFDWNCASSFFFSFLL